MKLRGGLLQAVQQSFEQLAHRLESITEKQRAYALPQQPFAAKFLPHRAKQGTTQLLGLIDQKREHHQDGQHHREILLAMTIVVVEVIPLIFQRIERLIFDLPPRSTPSHQLVDVRLVHAKVGHPAKMLHAVLTDFPVLDEVDADIVTRFVERHIIDKPKAMSNPCGTVVPLIMTHPSGVLRRVHLREQMAMITLFDPSNSRCSPCLSSLHLSNALYERFDACIKVK